MKLTSRCRPYVHKLLICQSMFALSVCYSHPNFGPDEMYTQSSLVHCDLANPLLTVGSSNFRLWTENHVFEGKMNSPEQ